MRYKNYIFDLYGTLIDIHTDEEFPELWKFMADYLKDHFGTVTTAPGLKKDYAAICKDETEKLAAINGSVHPEIKIEWVWHRLIEKDCSDDEMRKSTSKIATRVIWAIAIFFVPMIIKN